MTDDLSYAAQKLPKLHGPPPQLRRAPLIAHGHGAGWLSDTIAGLVESSAPRWWKAALAASLALLAIGLGTVVWLISTGVGIWGVSHPVMWGWDVVNFVWWIGIAHAGTLISAILFLLRQRWRTSINRAAEAMTLFAVCCAAIYPLIHVGRPWLSWWLLPIPNSNAVWPQFKSPLIWDVFAVLTYFVFSTLFFYLGLVPDFAVLRDRAKTRVRQIVYGFLALGWTGSIRQWRHYEKAYLILAGLGTALVISVHSIVSLDFSATQLPGWHSTIFPPYFVAGAIFSGMAMVLTLFIPLRRLLKIEEIVTPRHIDLMCKVTLAAGCIVAYAYAMEFFTAWNGSPEERAAFFNHRLADPFVIGPWLGIEPAPHWRACWTMLACNIGAAQLLWWRKIRSNLPAVFVIAILINIGMWFERFVIIVTSVEREFLPSNWGQYSPATADILVFLGSFGLFLTLFLLFIRYLPLVAMAEVKGVVGLENPTGSQQTKTVLENAPANARFLVARFNIQSQFLRAATLLHEKGVASWDAHTPFPVHGLDRATSQCHSRVGWFAFSGGAVGFFGGMALIGWMNGVNYPILAGGKPAFSLWAAFPAAFETAILCASIAAFLGMLHLAGLPRWHHPLLKNKCLAPATHDGCIIVVDMSDPRFSPSETPALLLSAGASSIQYTEE